MHPDSHLTGPLPGCSNRTAAYELCFLSARQLVAFPQTKTDEVHDELPGLCS